MDNQEAIKSLAILYSLSSLDPVLQNTIELWQNAHLSNVEREKTSKILEFYPHAPSGMYELGNIKIVLVVVRNKVIYKQLLN